MPVQLLPMGSQLFSGESSPERVWPYSGLCRCLLSRYDRPSGLHRKADVPGLHRVGLFVRIYRGCELPQPNRPSSLPRPVLPGQSDTHLWVEDSLVDPEGEEAAYSPVWACVGHDKAIPVQPGETRVDALHISGPNTFDGVTGLPFGVLEGKFQLGYQVRLCAEDDSTCSSVDAAGRSNLFEVRLAR